MPKKSKERNPFEGLWHIVSMDQWVEDYFNEEVQAFIEFEGNGNGHFQFGYVQGYMDWRPATRDGEPAVEWPWEGTDGADMTPMTGRGGSDRGDGTTRVEARQGVGLRQEPAQAIAPRRRNVGGRHPGAAQ